MSTFPHPDSLAEQGQHVLILTRKIREVATDHDTAWKEATAASWKCEALADRLAALRKELHEAVEQNGGAL